MHWLWVMMVGAAVGAFAGAISSPSWSLGWISHILMGTIGALLGELLLGPVGSELTGMTVFPAAVGALSLVLLTVVFTKWLRVR